MMHVTAFQKTFSLNLSTEEGWGTRCSGKVSSSSVVLASAASLQPVQAIRYSDFKSLEITSPKHQITKSFSWINTAFNARQLNGGWRRRRPNYVDEYVSQLLATGARRCQLNTTPRLPQTRLFKLKISKKNMYQRQIMSELNKPYSIIEHLRH